MLSLTSPKALSLLYFDHFISAQSRICELACATLPSPGPVSNCDLSFQLQETRGAQRSPFLTLDQVREGRSPPQPRQRRSGPCLHKTQRPALSRGERISPWLPSSPPEIEWHFASPSPFRFHRFPFLGCRQVRQENRFSKRSLSPLRSHP